MTQRARIGWGTLTFWCGLQATSALVKQQRYVKLLQRELPVLLLLATVPLAGQTQKQESAIPDSYQPITGQQRFKWFVQSTVGPASLGTGILSAGIGTAQNKPEEYGPSWDGFGKRYGMRLTGVSTGNAMEAGLGALWGEDPRYFRASGQPFDERVRNILASTFAARDRQGRFMPAYARYLAVPGNNFLSNTWRADSESSARDAAIRTLWGFLGRMGSNAFREFWPDVRRRIAGSRHKADSSLRPE